MRVVLAGQRFCSTGKASRRWTLISGMGGLDCKSLTVGLAPDSGGSSIDSGQSCPPWCRPPQGTGVRWEGQKTEGRSAEHIRSISTRWDYRAQTLDSQSSNHNTGSNPLECCDPRFKRPASRSISAAFSLSVREIT
ncbi:hypothetical protein BaRGS_00029078 [Batillaria attramentaria]|uniref:Uncharacterized protein n=1 Tax=Batillaria attramentaria TaxID=370345 RepID=A0ABD0JYC5_9CAEN